jgi:hypothetical protein
MMLLLLGTADRLRSLSCTDVFLASKSEISMQKFATTLLAAALVTATAYSVSAQTISPGSAGFHAQIKNATPLIQQAACNGRTGGHGCGPGHVWNGNRCVPC